MLPIAVTAAPRRTSASPPSDPEDDPSPPLRRSRALSPTGCFSSSNLQPRRLDVRANTLQPRNAGAPGLLRPLRGPGRSGLVATTCVQSTSLRIGEEKEGVRRSGLVRGRR
ncbi:unnamed protein product [Linum trigynum]|uniref:Uncharacterized protein n=1 Tax=Linum trigynum TaxID=586398 RepID=A0AAV2DPZ6_9ROSI